MLTNLCILMGFGALDGLPKEYHVRAIPWPGHGCGPTAQVLKPYHHFAQNAKNVQ